MQAVGLNTVVLIGWITLSLGGCGFDRLEDSTGAGAGYDHVWPPATSIKLDPNKASRIVIQDEAEVDRAIGYLAQGAESSGVPSLRSQVLGNHLDLYFDDGTHVLWKRKTNLFYRDVGVYKLDKEILHFGVVPAVKEAVWQLSDRTQDGYVHLFIEGYNGDHVRSGSDYPKWRELFAAAGLMPQGWRMATLDYLIGQNDRNDINNSIVLEDGRVVAVDHSDLDLADFDHGNFWIKNIEQSRREFPDDLVQQLQNIYNHQDVERNRITELITEIYPRLRWSSDVKAQSYVCVFYAKINFLVSRKRLPTSLEMGNIRSQCKASC